MRRHDPSQRPHGPHIAISGTRLRRRQFGLRALFLLVAVVALFAAWPQYWLIVLLVGVGVIVAMLAFVLLIQMPMYAVMRLIQGRRGRKQLRERERL